MPAAIGAAHPSASAADSADMLGHFHPCQRWQQHQRHEQLHRPAYGAAVAADLSAVASGAAAACAAGWLLAAAAVGAVGRVVARASPTAK